MTKLHFKSIQTIGEEIRTGEVSPIDLTRYMLDRINTHDEKLKSYVTVMADTALAEAKAAEDEIARGHYRGPLHGVPIAVKDLCFTKGIRTMGGCAVLMDHVPDFDATVVRRLRDAGAGLLG